MLKKFFSTLALTSLLVGGFSASQANAAAPNVNPANIAKLTTRVSVPVTDKTQIVIPAGLETFTISSSWNLDEAFLVANAGKTITVRSAIQLPNGTPLSVTQFGSSSAGYTVDYSGGIYGNSLPAYFTSYPTGALVIPANATGYSGDYSPSFYVTAASGSTLPAGTYTLDLGILVDSGTVSDDDFESAPTFGLSYKIPGYSFTAPAGTSTGFVDGYVCLDTSKVAVGDTVEASLSLNGQTPPNLSAYWSTKTGYKSYVDNGFRSSSSQSIVLTQFDLDFGLQVAVQTTFDSFVADATNTIDFRLSTVTQDNTDKDVSGSCAPAKPNAPTLSAVGSNLGAGGNFSVGSSLENGQCAIYETSAPDVIVSTSRTSTNQGDITRYSCGSFTGLTAGKSYVVRFRSMSLGVYSEYSEPSLPATMPTPGYTTSPYAGVVEAGKIVKVNDNSLPVENFANNTTFVPDGKGGFYYTGSRTTATACPPTCGPTSVDAVRLRHSSLTSFDSTFAGSGSVVMNNFNVANSFQGTVGYYGTNKDKWMTIVNGTEGQTSTAVTKVVLGNTADATTTTKTLTVADVNPVCAAASAGFIARPGPLSISPRSAPTANPFVLISCSKEHSQSGMTTNYVSLPVLASMDATTGALTFKAALGTPSAEANNFIATVSISPNAASGEVMFTAFVTSQQITAFGSFPSPNTGTVADHSVIRIDSTGTVLSTTNNAWGTSGGNMATDPTLGTYAINSGRTHTLVRSTSTPASFTVVSFGATGAGTAVPVDMTASAIATPSIGTVSGFEIPQNENLLPVSVSGAGKFAAGWIDLTTGALSTGEVLTYTLSSGLGVTASWFRGNDKNTYLVYTDASKSEYLTVLKWIDPRYTAPVGAVPAVISKDVKYSKNTPAAGAKVTLTGTDLDEVISAKIGANVAALGTKTATSLQLTIPTASANGNVDITLTTADGDTVVDTFTYVGLGVAQTVTVAALASAVTVGDADLALSAQVAFSPVDAGTAGAITWSSETPAVCSIVANKARLLTAGTCTVKATAAASGLLLAGSDTESTTVAPGTVVAAAQTVTLTGPTKVVVDLDGFNVVSSTSSGLAVVYSTTTPSVCTVSSTGYVVAIAEGTCEITSSQAGNANWLAASKSLTITVAKTPSTPLTEKGDIKKPLVLSKTGTFLKSGDTQLGWNRSKGTLGLKLSVVYVGPVKATASFKVGSKTYTCSASFGITKKQATSKMLTLTSPNLCTGKTEKTQLAALKKITTSTVVTVTVVRDMYVPTTYKKVRTKTRVLYAKLG